MADEEKEKKVKGDQPDTSIKVTILKTDMSEEMVADIFTKPLPKVKHCWCVEAMGVADKRQPSS